MQTQTSTKVSLTPGIVSGPSSIRTPPTYIRKLHRPHAHTNTHIQPFVQFSTQIHTHTHGRQRRIRWNNETARLLPDDGCRNVDDDDDGGEGGAFA